MELEDFKLLDRHGSDDKCPKCLTIFVNFMIVSDDLLGCLTCGSVFVKKEVREFVRDHQKEILSNHGNPVLDEIMPVNTCACGFAAKSLAGLRAHQRKCKNG